jgi:hypothetical protein
MHFSKQSQLVSAMFVWVNRGDRKLRPVRSVKSAALSAFLILTTERRMRTRINHRWLPEWRPIPPYCSHFILVSNIISRALVDISTVPLLHPI